MNCAAAVFLIVWWVVVMVAECMAAWYLQDSHPIVAGALVVSAFLSIVLIGVRVLQESDG